MTSPPAPPSRHLRRGVAVCAALSIGFVARSAAAVPSSFHSDFDALDRAGAGLYDFDVRYPQSATTWETTHLPTGGYRGSGAPHVVVHGCAPGPGCNTSEHQFNIGWVTPPIGGSHAIGEAVFVRFRIRFDDDTTFPIGQFAAKFILYGTTGTSPNSRWITHLYPPFANNGCTLGFDYSYMGWTPMNGERVTHGDWGLAGPFDSPAIAGRYAGFTPNVNISWSCAPAVLVTRPNHAAPVPKTQHHGAASTDGWYHLQFQAVSGAPGQAAFRSWANHNDFATPSSQRLSLPEGLGVTGWAGGVNVGGYWGTQMPTDIGFVIDDFEIGTTFDPAWYPGALPGSAPPGDGGADGGSDGGDATPTSDAGAPSGASRTMPPESTDDAPPAPPFRCEVSHANGRASGLLLAMSAIALAWRARRRR